MVLAASGTFEQLLTYVVFVGWIFYALGAACVFVLRRTQPDAERPFRVPGYPWTPLLFIVAAVALVLNTIATQPGRAAIGISVVLLGLPVYFLWRRRPWRALGLAQAAEGRPSGRDGGRPGPGYVFGSTSAL